MAAITRLGLAGFGIRRAGSFSGKTPDAGAVIDVFLGSQVDTGTGIKKPGIPADAPDWLKTSLEILEGRRDNKIAIPNFQDLTFSSPPTQVEVQALYGYTNTMRDALQQIIDRLDG